MMAETPSLLDTIHQRRQHLRAILTAPGDPTDHGQAASRAIAHRQLVETCPDSGLVAKVEENRIATITTVEAVRRAEWNAGRLEAAAMAERQRHGRRGNDPGFGGASAQAASLADVEKAVRAADRAADVLTEIKNKTTALVEEADQLVERMIQV